ncbi:MAG TPA: CocE/NonD family hydrolase [Actinomycetota bacterium]|nr:CocE/NonD family hydrolase [Actinomycetota bacterium]
MPLEIDVTDPAPPDPRAEQTMVPMRDGVRLATDVFLASGPAPSPTVLVRLPYDKGGRYTFMSDIAPSFTDRGYAFVVQDVRGKFRSEGETLAFVHEIDDGYDTLEWIVSQPWCDGSVGMWGDSYYGYTQWAAVASEHPALKAIVPRVTTADLAGSTGDDPVIPLYLGEYLAMYWLDDRIYRWATDYAHRPLAEVFDEAIGRRSESFDRFVATSAAREPLEHYPGNHPFDALRIPVLHTGGWFDNIMPEQMRDYEALTGRADVADLQYLEMNSTDHENYHLDLVPIGPEDDHDTDDEALARMLPRYLRSALDFFDRFLKGIDREIPRVRWHHGNVGWRTAPTWPPPGARELRLHLASAERAPGAGGGRLATTPETTATTARWLHDPDDLVPSTVVDPFSFLRECPNEAAVASRPDVLTFTTDAFDRPLDLLGPVSIRVCIGSTAPSTAVFAKLVDAAPDGSALMLTRGQTMLRGPDPSRPVSVDLAHIGYRVLAGHRLRLQLASSDSPLYLPPPGTEDDPWRATAGRPSDQVLRVGNAEAFLSLTVDGSTRVAGPLEPCGDNVS